MCQLTLSYFKAHGLAVRVQSPTQLWRPVEEAVTEHSVGSSRREQPELWHRAGKAQGARRDLQAVHFASERGAGSKVGWGQEHEET